MAETATAPAADATAAARPQKPDEDAYQKALTVAEKEHKDVMTRFVRRSPCRIGAGRSCACDVANVMGSSYLGETQY